MEKALNGAFSSIQSSVLSLAATLGVGFSIAGIEEMISGAIAAEAELGRIGARAGVSGEEISKLSTAARLSHTDLSDLADMSAKLSKALLVSQDAGTKQAAVFKALGFSSSDTARLLADPTNALFEFSKSISGLSEGNKVAAMMVAIGRGGNQAAAALDELSKQTSLVATRTNEEIAAAKDFEDRLVQLSIKSDNLKTALGNALLGPLTDAVDAFTKMATGAGGAKDMVDKLAEDGSIKEWARGAIIAIETVIEGFALIGRGVLAATKAIEAEGARLSAYNASFQLQNAVQFGATPEQYKQLEDDLKQSLEHQKAAMADANTAFADLARKRSDFLTGPTREQFAAGDAAAAQAAARGPGVEFGGDSAGIVQQKIDKAKAANKLLQDAVGGVNRSASAGEDPTKKRLEAQLAALSASIKAEESILALHNQFLDADFAHGDLSIESYYQGINDDITKGLVFKRAAFNEEIAATETFIASREKLLATGNKKDPGYVTAAKDIEDANKKIITITEQLTSAEDDAAKKSIKAWYDRGTAIEVYRDSLRSITAELATLEGRTADAARINTTNLANQLELRKLAKVQETGTPEDATANTAAIQALNAKNGLIVLQAELNDKAKDFSNISDKLSNSVERINLQYQLGAITELDALAKSSDAINSKISALSKEADVYADLAKKAGDTREGLALQNQADQIRTKIDALIVQADALNKKFRDIFVGSTTTFLTDIIEHTKTAKQIWLDYAKSIETSISQIASKNLAESLFGTSGSLGGIPSFFAKLFGGQSQGQVPGDAYLPGALGSGNGNWLTNLFSGTATGAAGVGSAASTATALTLVDAPATAVAVSLAAAAAAADAFAVAAAAAAGASAASSGSSYASAIAAAVASGGSFAVGTDYVPRDMIAKIHQGEAIIPASQNRGGGKSGNVFQITQNIMPGASRASADQAASALGMEIRRATARTG